MPRDNRRKKSSRQKSSFASDYAFVDVRISKADRAAFDKWAAETANDAIDLLASLANSGYKISVSWSDYNDCYTASFTGQEENGPNYHLVMTSRSDDMWEALMIGLYKHYVQCRGEDWPTDKQENDWG